ncbi:MAG: hypothetical protein SNI70_11320 [Rikenellaceae bacterium]
MEINAKMIDEMGGLVLWQMEPNTPNFPEINEIEIDTYLFDGYGVATHNNRHYKLSYKRLEEVADDEQVHREVNAYRYGNRESDDLEITIDDMVMTYGEFEECERSEYVSYLIEGLISNASNMSVEDGKRRCLSCDDYITQLKELESCPPKYLCYFTDDDDLVEQFDGEIYPVYDFNGDYLCDVLTADLLNLVEEGFIKPTHELSDLNETILTSIEQRDKVLAARFEAIIFLTTDKHNE